MAATDPPKLSPISGAGFSMVPSSSAVSASKTKTAPAPITSGIGPGPSGSLSPGAPMTYFPPGASTDAPKPSPVSG